MNRASFRESMGPVPRNTLGRKQFRDDVDIYAMREPSEHSHSLQEIISRT
jgi:hypothetical protein